MQWGHQLQVDCYLDKRFIKDLSILRWQHGGGSEESSGLHDTEDPFSYPLKEAKGKVLYHMIGQSMVHTCGQAVSDFRLVEGESVSLGPVCKLLCKGGGARIWKNRVVAEPYNDVALVYSP